MHDFFDRLDNRAPAARETALFRDLGHILSVSRSRVPALRVQLKGVDIARLRTRADLERIPVRRRADLLASQDELSPFGGYAATRMAALSQVFSGPGSLHSPAGQAKDWWGVARALYAAGLRKGSLALNAFPYDLVPFGHMVEAGARAIGCPVIPAGNAEPGLVADVAARLAPRFFAGPADRLKGILDAAAAAERPLPFTHAAVTAPVRFGLRSELGLRGLDVKQMLLLPEIGAVAFESGTGEGMTLAEGLILEIVDPATGRAVGAGEEGEVVLSRLNLDYPLLRYGTGLTASVLAAPATCGRTNTRISVPHAAGENDAAPAHIGEIRRRHPDLKMRLSILRASGSPHLRVEHVGGSDGAPSLAEALGETLRVVTRQAGTVEIVGPGTLDDDALPGDKPLSQ